MKQRRTVCLSFFVLLTLAGCVFPVKPGSHVWFYTFGTGPGADTLTPVSFLELRPDGSFSQDFGSFAYGHWEQKDQQLLLTNDDLPPRWKAFFYDDEDCRKANQILTDIFHRQTIAWANTDSKYKMFLGAFQQLEKFLHS
jgi:hypothetical protein